jgi:hypothetical protein
VERKGLFSCVGKQVTVKLSPVPELPDAVGMPAHTIAEITRRD